MTNERENDPLVPDQVEQSGRVLDNINNAENLADIPDPIDADPVENEPVENEPVDSPEPVDPPEAVDPPDPVEREGREWENEHPEGPF
jgi:hypothetical protein